MTTMTTMTMTIGERLKQYFVPAGEPLAARRYDLDWLRVIAFAILIFYHIGMMYVENWGFHIKSQHLSQPLENLMLIVEPWRMAVLWFISGVGIRFILAKVSVPRFIALRSYRLLLPLLFGVLVIVPPQLYYEMTFKGQLDMSYLSFYLQFFELDNPLFAEFQAGIWPHFDVNHLWYLRELWLFSLYLLVLLPLLNSKFVTRTLDKIATMPGFLQLILFSLPILAIQLCLGVDGEREVLGFTFVVYGYLIGWHCAIWQTIKHHRKHLLMAALLCYALLLPAYNWVLLNEVNNTDPLLHNALLIVYAMDRVLWLLAVLGFAHALLNHNSAKLKYLSQAVYPYYIVHQTIIIACGYELSQMHLGAFWEPVTLILLTLVLCALAFEVIRRVGVLRPVFGLSLKPSTPIWIRRLGLVASIILVTPIAMEIIL
jgi:hypothetical protein